MLTLRKTLLLLVAALLVWRVASTGMSAHYAERLKQGDEQAAGRALVWNARQPEALYRQALELRDRDPQAAAELLARAYAENPADARPMMTMAGLAQEQGDEARSEALVAASVDLMPSLPWIQRQAATYWVSRGELRKALEHWSLALETDPASRRQLFPILRNLAEDARTRPAFKPMADSPPSWWEAFFVEIAKNTLDVDTVRLLYAARRESSKAAVTQPERQAYVARLMKSGITGEAYVEWINGLDREERARLGLLYDGGFELEPGNWGFGWRFSSTPKALVDRATTYGVDGEKALHLLFDNHEGRFNRVFQKIFLDPGNYRFSGRVRTDSLQTKGGLKWAARCLLPEVEDLGESERFLGANEWRDFDFAFEVPDGCLLQEIRLFSAGQRSFEHKAAGGAWFDRLAIRRVAAQPPSRAETSSD